MTAQRRLALVIGNEAYRHHALRNPVRDANSMDSFLRRNGFEVHRHLNLRNRDEIAKAVTNFCEKIQPYDTTLFYYSGHGIQISNENYLIPTESEFRRESDVIDRAYEVDRLLQQLSTQSNSLNMVLLDACRDNPLEGYKSLRKGLAPIHPTPIHPSSETFISFATSCNQVAEDGHGYHSPYMEAFLEVASHPCLSLLECFAQLKDSVSRKTSGRQLPWKVESLGSASARFMFVKNVPCFSSPVSASLLHWKLITAWGNELPVMNRVIPEMVEELNQQLSGRLRIEIVPPPSERFTQMWDALTSNQVQLLHGSTYYWKSKIPSAVFFASIPFGMNHDEYETWMRREGLRLYEGLYREYGIKPFICGHTGQQAGGYFNKRIRDTNDLKGMWIRMPGLGGKVLEKFGVRIYESHANDIYEFFKRGEAYKAVEFTGPYDDYHLELHRIGRYFNTDGWQEPNNAYTLLVNQSAFEQLDPTTQALFAAIVSRYSERIYNQYLTGNRIYCKRYKEENIPFIEYPTTFKEVLLAKTKIVLDEYVQDINCVHCTQIWESYQRFLPNQRLTIRNFNVCGD